MKMSTIKCQSKDKQKNYKKYDTTRNYTLSATGSIVAVQGEDGDSWTHGKKVGNRECNHNNQSYIIWVTKTGRTITRNSKHIKAKPITAEQYLQDQLDKHTKSDPVEEFLKQFEQHHKTSTCNEQLFNSSNRNTTQNKQHERTHNNIGSAQSKRIPKDNIDTNHRDRNDYDNNGMRTWYGRLIKKLDRLKYS